MSLMNAIKPKSDQLNADDLLTGPRTITITEVVNRETPDQPVWIRYEGDGGKPYKPCKSMLRAMIMCWGDCLEPSDWNGRSITLYCDPNVKFGGTAVGGIRISHASHIKQDMDLMLTVTKGKRGPYLVKKMHVPAASRPTEKPPYPAKDFAENMGKFTESVKSGNSTPEKIIAYLEKTHALTKEQREFIEGLGK